jgi:hypothetical protein
MITYTLVGKNADGSPVEIVLPAESPEQALSIARRSFQGPLTVAGQKRHLELPAWMRGRRYPSHPRRWWIAGSSIGVIILGRFALKFLLAYSHSRPY